MPWGTFTCVPCGGCFTCVYQLLRGGALNFGDLTTGNVITWGFLILKMHTVAGFLISDTCILVPKFYTNTATGRPGYVVDKQLCLFVTCVSKLGCVDL